MHATIEHFLVNILVIIFFVFLGYTFIFDKPNSKTSKKSGIIIAGSLSIIVCMLFPTELAEGFFFDLRGIPIILGSLYGGFTIGIPLIITTIVFRFFLGGMGIIPSIQLIIIYIIYPFFSKFFLKLSVKQKSLFLIFAALIYSVTAVTLTFNTLGKQIDMYVSFIFITSEIIGILFVFNVIELLKKNLRFKQDLIMKEKLSVVSELAASISHEVRNPLTVTRGFIQILKDPELSAEQRKTYINLALSELDKANVIITEYLTFARPSSDSQQLINLSEEITKIAEIIKPYANMKNVEIQLFLETNTFIYGEKHKLHQAILNIVKNGVEAIINSGLLIITLKSTTNEIILTVEDNGVGMSKEQIEKIGEPYYTTKETGTGLGMMSVFSIIKTLDGEIEIKSQEGKGTKVSITFPSITPTETQKSS